MLIVSARTARFLWRMQLVQLPKIDDASSRRMASVESVCPVTYKKSILIVMFIVAPTGA
jgi:hypothetical protein